MCAPFVYNVHTTKCASSLLFIFLGGKWKCGKERKKEKGEGEEANWSETCESLAEEEERKRKWFMRRDLPPFRSA